MFKYSLINYESRMFLECILYIYIYNIYKMRLREKWTSLEAIAVPCASYYVTFI